jgi:competence protein ComFC
LALLWAETWEALAAVVFPTGCVACHALIGPGDPPLCGVCWDRIVPIDGACACGAPLPLSAAGRCARCRRDQSVVTRGAALGYYTGPLRACVGALKYRGRHRASRGLATRLLERRAVQAVLDGADALHAVPLHPKRQRERGFNQASLLARAISQDRLPEVTWLERVRDTKTQTALSAKDRRRNVRGAFAVAPGATVRNAVVVLVDDVATTGATLRECARTLLLAGAREVRSLVVARAE